MTGPSFPYDERHLCGIHTQSLVTGSMTTTQIQPVLHQDSGKTGTSIHRVEGRSSRRDLARGSDEMRLAGAINITSHDALQDVFESMYA